jgi:hypothetical protein
MVYLLAGYANVMFPCMNLFDFGSKVISQTHTLCRWVNVTTVSIEHDYESIISSSGMSSNTTKYMLTPGNSITLQGNTIRAECPVSSVTAIDADDCTVWPSSQSHYVTIQSPSNPSKPTLSISSPNTIGNCDDVTLDMSSSSGHAGRPWLTSKLSVESSSLDTTLLVSYINNKNYDQTLVIPHEYLTSGYRYTFTLNRCNFLQMCSSGKLIYN